MAFGMGETIGTAYVRILADGSGLDQSVRDQFDDMDMQSVGKKQGTEYTKGFNESLKSHKTQAELGKTLQQALRHGVGAFDQQGEFAGSQLIKGLRQHLQDEFGDEIGGVLHDEFQDALDSQTLDYDGLRHQLENGLGPMVARATKKISKEQDQALAKMLAAQEEFLKNETALYADNYNERARLRREDAVAALHSAQKRAEVEVEIEKEKWASILKDREDADRDFDLHIKRLAARGGTNLEAFAKNADKFGDSMGRAFGTGSRNDFLNIFGRFISIIPRAAAGFARLAEGAQGFGKLFMEGFGGLGEGASLLQKFSAGASKVGPLLAKGLAGRAAAVVALEVAASVASLALGGLTAIIGTLGSGLIGAVGLLTASMVPLVAGIGSVIIAYKSLSDAQKAAFQLDIKPLTDSFGELGDIAADEIFGGLGDELAKMTPFMDSLAEATTNVTAAVREQIDSWVALVNSGAFNSFRNVIASDLPGQINSMGGIFQNFVTSFTGFFRGISPVLSNFLSDLDRVTGKFSDWINSAQGNKAVTDFFDAAYQSVKAIGDALVTGGRLLGNFFRIGAQGGGDDLFHDLADTFRDWNEALIENEDSIKAWVKDGAEFVRVLGNIIEGVVAMIAALDHPLLRTVINAALQSIADTLKVLALIIQVTTNNLELFGQALGPIKAGLQGLYDIGALVGDALSNLGDLPGPLGTAFKVAGEGVGWFTDKVGLTGRETEKAATGLGGWNHGLELVQSMASRAGITVKQFAGHTADLTEEQLAARKAAKEQASAFIDISESADKAKTSLTEWIKIMEDQAKALRDYTANLKGAAENGVRKGLLKALQELGPEGARRVQQLANATESQVARANRAWGSTQTQIKNTQRALVELNEQKVPPKSIEVETNQALTDLGFLQEKINGVTGKEVPLVVTTTFRYANKPPVPGAPGGLSAAGRVVTSPYLTWAGEDGPEAIVPLKRPLSQVDPSVRALSAIAQGLAPAPTVAAGNSKVVEVGGIVVYSNAKDPEAVAVATMNHLVAASY